MKFSRKERKVLNYLSKGKDISFLKGKYSDIDTILDALKRLSCVNGTRTDDNGWIHVSISNIGEHNRRNTKPWYDNLEEWIKNHKRLLGAIVGVIILIIYIISGCKITDGFSALDCTKTLIQK